MVRIPRFSEGRESISSFKTRITEKVQSLQHMTSVGVGSFALNWYGLSTNERETYYDMSTQIFFNYVLLQNTCIMY